ncbi:MAG: dTDP-4-amino-4,6-dideoxy-D-glucose acyltransferase [Chloroflexi bacterium ADurb.Bin360]|nr:MAG: dTDP-4-amino-4,6-dideoxy-D-glucose acyltransferase [Chloroflexi bacterium ADurb.Bin360]
MSNQAYDLPFQQIGADVVIWPMAKIVMPEVISIGNSVIVDDFVFLVGGAKTIIGDFIHIASFTSITGGGEFIMEDFAGLSGGVHIYTGNEDYSGGCLTNPAVPAPYRVPTRSFVRIEKHAIIGANSVVLPGVVIGEGAVVGANSLITKSCDPWTINVGSPAKPIKVRPKERILNLEGMLRKEIFDVAGHYIPRDQRG